jgi:hypothetical protein
VCAKDKLVGGLQPLLIELGHAVVGHREGDAVAVDVLGAIETGGGVEQWAAQVTAQFLNTSTVKRFLVK